MNRHGNGLILFPLLLGAAVFTNCNLAFATTRVCSDVLATNVALDTAIKDLATLLHNSSTEVNPIVKNVLRLEIANKTQNLKNQGVTDLESRLAIEVSALKERAEKNNKQIKSETEENLKKVETVPHKAQAWKITHALEIQDSLRNASTTAITPDGKFLLIKSAFHKKFTVVDSKNGSVIFEGSANASAGELYFNDKGTAFCEQNATGGIDFYGFNPNSGEIKHHKHIVDTDQTSFNPWIPGSERMLLISNQGTKIFNSRGELVEILPELSTSQTKETHLEHLAFDSTGEKIIILEKEWRFNASDPLEFYIFDLKTKEKTVVAEFETITAIQATLNNGSSNNQKIRIASSQTTDDVFVWTNQMGGFLQLDKNLKVKTKIPFPQNPEDISGTTDISMQAGVALARTWTPTTYLTDLNTSKPKIRVIKSKLNDTFFASQVGIAQRAEVGFIVLRSERVLIFSGNNQ